MARAREQQQQICVRRSTDQGFHFRWQILHRNTKLQLISTEELLGM